MRADQEEQIKEMKDFLAWLDSFDSLEDEYNSLDEHLKDFNDFLESEGMKNA